MNVLAMRRMCSRCDECVRDAMNAFGDAPARIRNAMNSMPGCDECPRACDECIRHAMRGDAMNALVMR
jgi:hypothetical protein